MRTRQRLDLAETAPADDDVWARPGSDPGIAPAAGLIAGRYEILGLLGTGGMGSVYRVRDRALDEVVALKFLRHDRLGEARSLERFREEVRLARRVTHINVARTYDIGEHGGKPFLTMEYVDGEPLSRLLVRGGPLSPRRSVEIGLALCAGLGAAHEAGIVHRDLKPDNVLVGRSGRIVITDFGIARACAEAPGPHTAGLVGTPAYMAPEQVEGAADLDARADVYALGTVLYELVTGAPAWSGESFVAIAVARLAAEPPDPRARNPSLPDALARAIVTCMARRREQRFATAAEVAEALRGCLAVGPPSVAPPRELAATAARALRVAPAPIATDPSVAVLQFRSAGPPEEAWLAAELTEELTDALCTAGGLRVRPRSLVALHEAATADPRAIGRALDVHAVVEGSLRREGDMLRIVARLVSVADGFQVWARRLERPASELIAVPDELARGIAASLTRAEAGASRRGPMAADATEQYLRARHELRRSWEGMRDPARAVAAFEAALAKAPGDPDVLAGYAMARARSLNYGAVRGAGEPAATLAVAERAVHAAGHLGEPWLALGAVRYVIGDWPSAVEALRKALARAPGLLKAHDMLGHLLFEVGRVDEGVHRLETVLSLDPTAVGARLELARGLALSGHWDRTDALLALPVYAPEEHMSRMFARARTNMWRRAWRHEVSLADAGDHPQGRKMAAMYLDVFTSGAVSDGARAQIEAHIAEAPASTRFRAFQLQLATEMFAFAKDHDAVLHYLERALRDGLHDLLWLERCPLLDTYRGDPRFEAVHRELVARAALVHAALDRDVGDAASGAP